eukprot:CAMPEP_0168554926 /NCGR_PEP_ID=MMETSP0413-20121227/8049_1 /TAXON_ID=136452 /ORGANISM="Filamoeba nolandi, Strain NC-AS-23-1" /LENGTH=492 /DNA_ID=CAMNT_0008585717 /DNA_START=304 /DNA_END=1782 /DNA_ORIENTATION=+
MMPETIAFAFVAGVSPLVGLYASFILMVVTSILGGRPGSISGAAGATAVLHTSLVAKHGVEYLFASLLLVGIFEILIGAFNLTRFIKFVSMPIMTGFVNGLSIVIGRAQFTVFRESTDGPWLSGNLLYWTIGLVFITMLVMVLFPFLTKHIPSSLVAIGIVMALEYGIGIGSTTVGDRASVSGGFPSPRFPHVPFNSEMLGIIIPHAIITCIVALLETLLLLQLIDEITETKGNPNRECVAQGVGNILCGLFGALGGCAMIGQAMVNLNSGGRGRLPGFFGGILLLIVILAAHKVIEMIPLASLAGIMFVVVLKTFDWTSLRLMYQSVRYYRQTGSAPLLDSITIILVTVVTVLTDLAIAVGCGIVFSSLVYVWKNSQRIHATTSTRENSDGTTEKVYHIHGPLFFASVSNFMALFDPTHDPHDVDVDFTDSKLEDLSALGALSDLDVKYTKQHKRIRFSNLSDKSGKYIQYGGSLSKNINSFVELPMVTTT